MFLSVFICCLVCLPVYKVTLTVVIVNGFLVKFLEGLGVAEAQESDSCAGNVTEKSYRSRHFVINAVSNRELIKSSQLLRTVSS